MKFVKSAIKANLEIYKLLKKGIKKSYFKEHTVGAGGDVSMEIDLLAERIFIKHLTKYGTIISEESGVIGSGKGEIFIDPIDGSSNFATQFPYYGSSVALRVGGEVKAGIVANFANGDLFVKYGGKFQVAKMGEMKFRDVEKIKNSKGAIFEQGYKKNSYEKIFRKNRIKYRIPGAIALSLAYGHYVDFVFFSNNARDYDIMAGLYMCEDLNIYTDDKIMLICKNKKRFKALKKLLK